MLARWCIDLIKFCGLLLCLGALPAVVQSENASRAVTSPKAALLERKERQLAAAKAKLLADAQRIEALEHQRAAAERRAAQASAAAHRGSASVEALRAKVAALERRDVVAQDVMPADGKHRATPVRSHRTHCRHMGTASSSVMDVFWCFVTQRDHDLRGLVSELERRERSVRRAQRRADDLQREVVTHKPVQCFR